MKRPETYLPETVAILKRIENRLKEERLKCSTYEYAILLYDTQLDVIAHRKYIVKYLKLIPV